MNRYRDFWYPSLLDRKIHSQWQTSGGKTLGQRLNARVLEIIKEYQPKLLAAEKKRGVQEILAQAS